MAKRARCAVLGVLVVLGSVACSDREGEDTPDAADAAGSRDDAAIGAAGSGGGGGRSSAGGAGGSRAAAGTGGSTADAGGSDAGGDGAAPDAGVPAACPVAEPPGGFHASPDGLPTGDGSPEAPWDLATALAHPASVAPGATIWLHEGVYEGTFTSVLAGDAGDPISVRGFPGERAVLDGVNAPNAQILTINGAYSIFQDFEVTSSFATRVITSSGSNPGDARGGGIGMYAAGVKLVNLVIHDTGQGVGNWSPAPDGEVYGCIIFYNGWDAPDRGHGHGIYAQNETGKKYLTDNIVFRQFSYGIHGYTEGGAIDDFVVVGNIVFNNGEISAQSGFATDILVGGLQVAQLPLIDANATYFPAGEGSNNIGYSAGFADATITDNYFVAGDALRLVAGSGTNRVSGNTFVGAVDGFAEGDYPDNSYVAGAPGGSHVIVRPNLHDPMRAHIAIFNWGEADTVAVDVSDVLAPGDAFELVDVQNLFGAPVLAGVHSGAPIDVPMTSTDVATPVGDVPVAVVHTSKQFGAFLLRRLCP